jgi:hypothetical protein
MNKIKNLRIIKHFKSEDYNSIHGIYECDYNGQTTVFIRHGKEIGVVTFYIGLSLNKCISPVTESVATELINEVELKLTVDQTDE